MAFRVFHLLRVALGTMSVRTGAESRDCAPVLASTPRRVVLDTNVLVSLYIFADSRFAPLRARMESGEWQALSNAACFNEFVRVLGYPLFALTPERQQATADAYRASVALHDGPALADVALPRCKDRDD